MDSPIRHLQKLVPEVLVKKKWLILVSFLKHHLQDDGYFLKAICLDPEMPGEGTTLALSYLPAQFLERGDMSQQGPLPHLIHGTEWSNSYSNLFWSRILLHTDGQRWGDEILAALSKLDHAHTVSRGLVKSKSFPISDTLNVNKVLVCLTHTDCVLSPYLLCCCMQFKGVSQTCVSVARHSVCVCVEAG